MRSRPTQMNTTYKTKTKNTKENVNKQAPS